jgi:hypothetical protein
MGWVNVTEDDLKTRLTGPEINNIKTAALAAGQADPLPVTIANVANEIRGRLRNVTVLESGAKVPDSLLLVACDIVRMRLITRFPDAGLSTPERLLEYQVAVAAVERLGPFVVETPGNPETVTLAQRGVALIGQRTALLDPAAQDGI